MAFEICNRSPNKTFHTDRGRILVSRETTPLQRHRRVNYFVRPGRAQRMAGFCVEFEIADEDRFRRLAAVFDALRAAKQSDEWRDDDYWLGFFDAEARSRFWWPTPAEQEDWNRRWFSTPVPQRFTDPSLVTPWDFGSMIDAFRNGDYDLLGCERVSPQAGRLVFDPHGWPYGGTGCMRALVEAFGHRVTAEPEA